MRAGPRIEVEVVGALNMGDDERRFQICLETSRGERRPSGRAPSLAESRVVRGEWRAHLCGNFLACSELNNVSTKALNV